MKPIHFAYLVLGLGIVGVLAFLATSATPAQAPIEESSDITYVQASSDLISVFLPFPGAVVGKTFTVTGEARGYWFFEGSFPLSLTQPDGTVLFSGIATAEGEWMTEEFVPFSADITVNDQSYIGPATLTLSRDNPSGMPEHDAYMSFDIVVEY